MRKFFKYTPQVDLEGCPNLIKIKYSRSRHSDSVQRGTNNEAENI